MKTMLKSNALMLSAALLLGGGNFAFGVTPVSPVKYKTFAGIATTVNQKEKAIQVKGFWGEKTFEIGGKCGVSLQDKPEASLADLHAGQKVELRYADAHGVLIADHISQQNMTFAGYISTMNPAKHTLSVKHGIFTRHFTLPQDCAVALKDDKAGALGDLKVGHTVNVIYERGNGIFVAREIERPGSTFVGTIEAIDAGTRTIKADGFAGEKKFCLADACQIVVGGQLDGGLRDLRIGERVVLNYENANGVLVADRIGEEPAARAAKNSQEAKADAEALFWQSAQRSAE
jgi:hypothetical protein